VYRAVVHTVRWLIISLIRLAVLFFVGASALAQTPQPTATPSIVYCARDPDAINHFQTNRRVVRAMVDRLVLALTKQPNLAKAWSTLVSPNDKVGIKISAAGGELFTTHRDVVNAIVDGLVEAGHSRANIIVWDREIGGIKAAGYRPNEEGYRIMSVTPRDGYDDKKTISAPFLGNLVWGDFEFRSAKGIMPVPVLSDTENTSSVSHFARILTSEVTKVINVPVMSNSETNGVAGCLYNMTIPNIDNWRRFADSTHIGSATIAEIYADPVIAKKVVLNLMDGLIAQYAAGPKPEPNYAVHNATLMASKDPVAIDAIALRQLEQWRLKEKLPPLTPAAGYIPMAEQYRLGNADASRIEVRNIGR
jgi:uncharacterized protein (DUF362 family)